MREHRDRETRDAVDDDEHAAEQHEAGAHRFSPPQAFAEDERRQQDEGDRLDRDQERRVRRRRPLKPQVGQRVRHAEAEDSHPEDLRAVPADGGGFRRAPQERQQHDGGEGESSEREQRRGHVEQGYPLGNVGRAVDDVGEEENEVGAGRAHTAGASPR